MKLLTITLLTTCTLLCRCCGSDCGTADASLDYAAINAQAAEQYLHPIRPGYEGRNPFWNGFAKKFIYAPAFDFDEAERLTDEIADDVVDRIEGDDEA